MALCLDLSRLRIGDTVTIIAIILLCTSAVIAKMLSPTEFQDNLRHCGKRNEKSRFKIYRKGNDTPAKNGQFPWMAALLFIWSKDYDDYLMKYPSKASNLKFCGGTLISTRHVLTAAHCVVKSCNSTTFDSSVFSTSTLRVVVGVTDLNETATSNIYGVREIQTIPDFGYPRKSCLLYGDIAILELERDVQFDSSVNSACLLSKNDVIRQHLQVAGFGGNPKLLNGTSKLLYTDVQYKDRYLCEKTYVEMYSFKVTKDKFCTTEMEGNSCKGDSGGPIMQKGNRNRMYLSGLVSYGTHCSYIYDAEKKNENINDDQYPGGVYVDVRHYLAWICKISGVCP